jgi:hypothetical protein
MISSWYRTGYLNYGNAFDLSNPKLITITATGYCGVTSLISSPTTTSNAWNGDAVIPLLTGIYAHESAVCYYCWDLSCVCG